MEVRSICDLLNWSHFSKEAWTPAPTTWALGPLSPPHGHLDPCPHRTLLHQSFLTCSPACPIDCANICSYVRMCTCTHGHAGSLLVCGTVHPSACWLSACSHRVTGVSRAHTGTCLMASTRTKPRSYCHCTATMELTWSSTTEAVTRGPSS